MMALTSTRIHSVCDGSDTDDIRDRIDQSDDGQDRRKDPPPPYSPIKGGCVQGICRGVWSH